MAHTDKNVLMNGFHGKIGNQIVIRQRNGKTIMSNIPSRGKNKPKGKRLENCERFKMAQVWAKTIQKKPSVYAAYKARASGGQTAYNIAVADFMMPPAVTDINISGFKGRTGDIIIVLATDDFKVKEVLLQIIGPDGKFLESGKCKSVQSGAYWQYTTLKAIGNLSGITIKAIAKDNPGHIGEMVVMIK